jgi:3-deoxy-D-manno-octulosonic-acid transferase
MSPRSARRYGKFAWLLRPIFSQLSHVGITDAGDAAIWHQLGLPPERITHTGSIKFDQAASAPPPPGQVAHLQGLLKRAGWDACRVLLAASTHAGEERLLADTCRQLRQTFPQVRLLAVPRHVERAGEIQAELAAAGFSSFKRTDLETALPEGPVDVLIVNTTGELRAWLPLAEVVLIGKSFYGQGGQNPAEGIAAGKAVVCGPHMENFSALMTLLLKAGGLLQVSGEEELVPTLGDLLSRPAEAAVHAQRGQAALDAHTGATLRTATILENL